MNNTIFNMENAKSNSKSVIQGKKYRITVLSDVLLRLEYNEKGIFNDYPSFLAINRKFDTPQFEVKQDNVFLQIENNYFKLEYTKEKHFVGSKVVPDANMKVVVKDTDKIWYPNHPEVRNYNGSAYSLDNASEKIEFSKGLYSPDGFACLDDSNSLIFNNGNPSKRPTQGVDIYLFVYRKDFDKALKDYFILTGMPTLIPRYALGVWWNKNEIYNYSRLNDINNEFKRNGFPYSLMVLGDKWHVNEYAKEKNIKSGFTFNPNLYPNPVNATNLIHKSGAYFGIDINTDQGIYPYEEKYKELVNLLSMAEGKAIPFNVYNMNIINFFRDQIISDLKNKGVDLFFISNNSKDKNSLFLLNHYLYNSYNEDKKRPALVSRNFGIASHRYGMLQSGETLIDWQTLATLPYYNLTAANIGLTWWSHDVGGYKNGVEDAELYMRYVQLATYSPLFRFSSQAGKYYKREPWIWDIKTGSVVKEYMKQRFKLIPYIYSEAYKYHKDGIPLIKPIYYKYPEIYDEPLYRNEYHFGSELFVAPITTKKDLDMNRVIQRMYLPKGTWYDFKTGKKFIGGKRYTTFYKDEDYPVFAKSGSIIPMTELNPDYLNSTFIPKEMEVHIFPGLSNNYNLYEDDGVSQLYKQGKFLLTNIDYNYRENNYTVIIRPVEGKSGVIPDTRDYKIRFRNTKFATDVTVYEDNTQIPFMKYVDGPDFVIEVKDVKTIKQLTINCKGNNIEIDAVRLVNEDIDGILLDLKINTRLKEEIAKLLFSEIDIKKKRIGIRKLRGKGLDMTSMRMFIKLLEYMTDL